LRCFVERYQEEEENEGHDEEEEGDDEEEYVDANGEEQRSRENAMGFRAGSTGWR
jgi:hypothetical protein